MQKAVKAITNLWSKNPKEANGTIKSLNPNEGLGVEVDDKHLSLTDLIVKEIGSLKVIIAKQEEELYDLREQVRGGNLIERQARDIGVALQREAFLCELERMIAFTTRYESHASLILVRIKNYSALSEELSVRISQMVDLDFGRFLGANIRKSDMVGSLGSGEYGLLIHHNQGETVSALGQRLVVQGLARVFSYGDHKISLSLEASNVEVQTQDTAEGIVRRARAKL